MTHALILDGDFLVFQAMSASETETCWEDNVYTLECDHNRAWEILTNAVEAIRSKRKSWENSKIIMCFTDKVNWRKDILPTYKANRKKTRKPTGYYAFVEKVMNVPEWNSFLRPTLEGDDCMGIIATKPSIVGCKTATICSPDKDFKTIPCEFFQTSSGEIHQQTIESAHRYHMYQTMIGDTTDGYSGISGVGETVATDFLNEPYLWESYEHEFKSGVRKGTTETRWRKTEKPEDYTLWDCMLNLALKYGVSPEELLVQAQVARICHASDFNFKTKEVILWQPTANILP